MLITYFLFSESIKNTKFNCIEKSVNKNIKQLCQNDFDNSIWFDISSKENVEYFCGVYVPRTHKISVGDSPNKKRLKREYPNVDSVGYRFMHKLLSHYNNLFILDNFIEDIS
jgi:hypothetical protein